MVAVADNVRFTDLGGRFIKDDHAGEHGAVCIYTGQIFMAPLPIVSAATEAVIWTGMRL